MRFPPSPSRRHVPSQASLRNHRGRRFPPARCWVQVEELEKRNLLSSGIQTIQHVVIIMQENRSFDHYFGTYPGADGIPRDADGNPTVFNVDPVTGKKVYPFHNTSVINFDGFHSNQAAIADIDGGKMDKFLDQARKRQASLGQDPGTVPDVMGYHTANEIPNYWSYAQNFVLQDHMFEPVLSWSLPAHEFLVSEWAATCTDPNNPMSCVNNASQAKMTLNRDNTPLFAWTDLTYLLWKNNVSWAYYSPVGSTPADPDDQPALAFWNPLPHFTDVHSDGQLGNIQDPSAYFQAAAAGTLPSVSWIMPNPANSEHPTSDILTGQAWVTSLVNAAMQGPEWDSTAIFLSWDDWGGFYDHEAPPTIDGNGYGLRVPGLVISPWVKAGLIDHQTLSFDAYAKFIEDDFLGSQRLDPATDGRPDPRPDVREDASELGDLANEFDFSQTPLAPLVLPLYPNSPTPDTGGPYTIKEGQSLSLDASKTIDLQGLDLTFAWTINGHAGAATGKEPTLTWSQLLADGITDEKVYFILVNVTDTQGYSTLSEETKLTIQTVAPSVTLSGKATATEGASYTLNLSASIAGDPDSFTIQWGDGTSATIAGTTASTTHTYAEEGAYTITATAKDEGKTYNAKNSLAITVQDAALVGQSQSLSPVENASFTGVVASFTDPGTDGTASDYSASITWGDGQSSTGTVQSDGNGGFNVVGTNTYAEEGSDSLTIVITDGGGSKVTITSSALVADAALLASTATVTPTVGQAFTGVIAAFRDPGTDGTVNDYSATITWGDGQSSTGTIQSDGNGGFNVVGSNTYAATGNHTVAVAISDVGGSTATVGSTANVVSAAASFGITGFPSPITAGVAGTFTVTALDGSGNTVTDYTGTVHFTSTDAQAILPANYTFTSAEAGVHTFAATLRHAGSQSITATDTTTSSLTGAQTGITVNPAAARKFKVAGFPRSITAGTAANFTVRVRDVFGNTVTGYLGTVHYTSSDGAATLPADYTFTSGDGGVHTFNATLITAGTQSLTATDTVKSSLKGTETGINVSSPSPGPSHPGAAPSASRPDRGGMPGPIEAWLDLQEPRALYPAPVAFPELPPTRTDEEAWAAFLADTLARRVEPDVIAGARPSETASSSSSSSIFSAVEGNLP
jgi:phospholipase C